MYVILLDRIDPQKCKQARQYRMNFNLQRNSPGEDVFLKRKERKKIYENFVGTNWKMYVIERCLYGEVQQISMQNCILNVPST